MKLLIIEDDEKISNLLTKSLTESQFIVENAFDGETGLSKITKDDFNLVILDIMLPKLDGVLILKALRASGNKVPVIILSAKETVEDIVLGLQSGADDYLIKPFSYNELLARINNLLRRTTSDKNPTVLSYDNLTLNTLTREVKRGDQLIELHVNEFTLLHYMLQNIDKVVTKSQILLKVWGYEFDPQTNVVDVLICRLRNKIDKDFDSKIIQTVRGVGYVIKKS